MTSRPPRVTLNKSEDIFSPVEPKEWVRSDRKYLSWPTSLVGAAAP